MRLCAAGLLLVACAALSGCEPREMGIGYASTRASKVDPSWAVAAQSCWPALIHSVYSISHLQTILADPLHFRAAFGVYGPFTDAEVESIAAHPVSSAPFPDHEMLLRATTPVLTLSQAESPGSPSPSQSAQNVALPQDALCAVQPGTPVGFK